MSHPKVADKDTFLEPAPPDFMWPQCPQSEAFIVACLDEFFGAHAFARALAERMPTETSTPFFVWVDHLILPKARYALEGLQARYGFVPDTRAQTLKGDVALWHPYADLPRLVLSESARGIACAIHVESIRAFERIHGLSRPVLGAPLSGYRVMRLAQDATELLVVERRGYRGYVPNEKPAADAYLRALQTCSTRRRLFDNEEVGMEQTLAVARALVADVGQDTAAWIFLEAEREYWQDHNLAGRVQKSRQDALGLGWANHDHHTFRASRRHFAKLIEILQTLGFKKRERFYAGADAGWGAQIMEQPMAGLVIFADVDLAPEEVSVDFSKTALPPMQKLATVGLWCALHGESILEAGMHHLEAQFDFELLREALKTRHIETMPPFSDFPHLRQAFTQAESWPVRRDRLEKLLRQGAISQEAYARFQVSGAIGSHMENLQRRVGFKGFNRAGVSHILREVHPETQVMNIKYETRDSA